VKTTGFGTVLGTWVRAQDDPRAFALAVDAIAPPIWSPDKGSRRRCQALRRSDAPAHSLDP
jgi:hypothetical protein